MSRPRRAMVFALLSVLLGGTAANSMSNRENALRRSVGELTAVLVTAAEIREGEVIGPSMLSIRQVPKRWVPVGALRNAAQADGLTAAVTLPAGSYLTAGTLTDPGASGVSNLSADERVATVVAVAAPGTVRRRGRVDVVVASSGSRPAVALRAAEVLAVRPVPGEPESGVARHRIEADLKASVSGALRLAQAAGEGAEIQLLPIGVSGDG